MHTLPLVFEANLLRFDGTVFAVEILCCTDEAEAVRRAGECATRWAAAVRLYQVPCVNTGSEAWQIGETRFVANVARAAAPLHATALEAKGITRRADVAAAHEEQITDAPSSRRTRRSRVAAALPLAATA
jgi:hypothetical protein